jgi:hypothetical protein
MGRRNALYDTVKYYAGCVGLKRVYPRVYKDSNVKIVRMPNGKKGNATVLHLRGYRGGVLGNGDSVVYIFSRKGVPLGHLEKAEIHKLAEWLLKIEQPLDTA